MSRGVKGPVKATTTPKRTATKMAPAVKKGSAPAKKPRKAYPSVEERIALADKQIEHQTKISAKRSALIEKTEATLNTRKAALAKNTTMLEKALSKKERLAAAKAKPAKATAPKLPPEQLKARRIEALAKARAAKKAEKAKVDQLLAALKDSGKSIDELLREVGK